MTYSAENILTTGMMNNVENQLNRQYHKETQGRLNGKRLIMDSLNIIQYLQAKKVENTDIPPFNDVRHCKFLELIPDISSSVDCYQ